MLFDNDEMTPRSESAPQVPIRVLLVDENRADYATIGSILRSAPGCEYELTWCSRYELALEAMFSELHQVILLDCQTDSGASDRLLRSAVKQSCRTPIVVMTDQLDEVLDREAIRSGAADYLIRAHADAHTLERSIRYAIDRKAAELRLARLAYYDPLTRVPNRILFRDRLQRAIERARRDDAQLALDFGAERSHR